MPTYLRCSVCHRDVRGVLAELYIHCDTYHYAQSPDLIFPQHGLHYKPMDTLLKRELVARGEHKMGSALLGGLPYIADPPIQYIVNKPQLEIIHEHTAKSVIDPPTDKRQMRVIYTSSAWEELICQGWVTVKTVLEGKDEMAVMEQF